MNVILNGTFLDNIAGWTVERGVGPTPPAWNPVGNPGGSLRIDFEGRATQQFNVSDIGAEYRVQFDMAVPEPGGATGEVFFEVYETGYNHEFNVATPLADDEFHAFEFTYVATAAIGTVSIDNDGIGNPYVLIDNVRVERVAVSPLVPLIKELQKRRRDIAGVKHAQERYGEALENAVDNAPLPIWPHKHTDVTGLSKVQRYAFQVDDLENADRVLRVGIVHPDDAYTSIGRYTVMDDNQVEGGVELRLDEADWLPNTLRIEYRSKPYYDFSLPDNLPLDREWILAQAMIHLLMEADYTAEPMAMIERDLAYWAAIRDRREATISPRFEPERVQTLAPRRYAVSRSVGADPVTAAPTADFTASPTKNYSVPADVQFLDRSTGAESWLWDFGDGNSSTEQNPLHTYYGAGKYTVVLTVTNSVGSNSIARYEFIQVGLPQANFEAVPSSGTYPLLVQFNNTTTLNEPESGVTWLWNFGDGYYSDEKNPSHTYVAAGTWPVALTATGVIGSDTVAKQVLVAKPADPPVVDFTAVPVSGNVPLEVQFTPVITGSYTGVEWDFGDGSPFSNELSPIHTYTVANSYTPVLRVMWDGGAPVQVSKTDHITAIATGEPVASFYALTTEVVVGENVDFRDTSTPTADITAWDWDFGDLAGTSAVQNPAYAYDTEGNYTVTLEVTSPGGTNSTFITNYITVLPAGTSRVDGAIWEADFNENGGSVINDRTANPYNLTLSGNTAWSPGKLTVLGETSASGTGPPTKIINAVKASDEMTFEAWLKSDNSTTLRRLIDIAVSGTDVNFQVRQNNEDRFRAYLRSTTSNADGSPELETGAGVAITSEDYMHLVMRRATDDTWELIIDNDTANPVAAGTRDGSFSAWDDAAEFVLFNQVAGSRAWLGDIYLAAIYPFSLTDPQVEQNFYAGPEGGGPPPPPGDNFYVSTTGSDSSGDGMLGSPWRTIGYAASQLSAGDTLYILGGTYNEEVTIAVSGSSGSPITVQAYPGATVVVKGGTGEKSLIVTGDYVDVKDVYVENDNATTAVELQGDNSSLDNLVVGADKTKKQATSLSYGVDIEGEDCIVENCEIRGFRDGVRIQGVQSSGVQVSNPLRFVLRNNFIHTMKKMPIDVRLNGGEVLGGLVENNLIWNAGEDGVGATSDNPPEHKGIMWRGNVFVECSENAVDQKSMEEMFWENNLFMRAWGTGDAGIDKEPPYESVPGAADGAFPLSEIVAGKERSVLGTFTRGSGDSAARDRGIVFRRNVFIDTAQPLRFMDGNTPEQNVDLKMYNNTIIACNRDVEGYNSDYGAENIGRGGMVAVRTQDNSQGIRCYWINNIVVDQNWAMVALKVDQHVCDANLYFESGSGDEQFAAEGSTYDWELMTFAAWKAKYSHEALSISGDDPDFVNAPARPDSYDWAHDAFRKTSDLLAVYDVRLQAGSPAEDAGRHLTLVAANSSGATITVDDSMFFCDGWDNPAIEGDKIKIGTDTVTEYTIQSIDYDNHLITLNTSVGVSIGDKVYLTYSGSGPNIGAY